MVRRQLLDLNAEELLIPEIIDALCAEGGRLEDSKIAKPVFAKQVVIDWVAGVAIKYRSRRAVEQARIEADLKARSEIIIT